MEITVTVSVAAPAEAAWSILADVTAWPSWTPSVSKVEWVSGDDLVVGATVRIKQPGFPAARWTVTEVTPGRSFTWESRAPGILSVGRHVVTPDGDADAERCGVELGISQTGFFAPVLALLAGARSRRYVQMEGDRLKERAEASVTR